MNEGGLLVDTINYWGTIFGCWMVVALEHCAGWKGTM